MRIVGAGATGNRVQGNYIGTDLTGTKKLGNLGTGVVCSARRQPDWRHGGRRRQSHFRKRLWVQISAAGATGNLVQGNLIGTDISGTAGLGNIVGILLFEDSEKTTVGGPAGAGNIIAFNIPTA